MAVVSRGLGRGAFDFRRKTFNRNLLKNLNKQGRSAVQASSLSAGFVFSHIQNGELYGSENPADSVTVGVSPESYTRVTPLLVECEYYLERNKEYLLPHKTRGQNIARKRSQFLSYANFERTSLIFGFGHRPHLGSRRLCWGNGQLGFIRPYSTNGAQSEPLFKTKTGYYEILGVTPTATQAQVKTAYYKQSFIYHPDRNASSDEATVRFSEINEAYTVLGNKALRKKYDRGLLSRSDLVATGRPSGKDTTGSSGTRQTGSRRSVMGADSRGGVFDFDKFFKAHYGEQLQREKHVRFRKEEMLRKEQETMAEKKMGRMMEIGVGMMLAMAVAILLSLKQR